MFGFTLLEPLSTLMNWVLAGFCYYFYRQLKGSEARFLKYWSWFFLLFSISLVFGGFAHLLFHYIGMTGKIPGWSSAILGVAAGELAMLQGMDARRKQMLMTVVRSKVFATFVMLFIDLSFTWVMVHTAGFWLFVGIIAIQRMWGGEEFYKYFLFGMSFLLVMAAVKIAEFDLHPAWFNRDDIAHFLMLGMYWYFFRGVQLNPAYEKS